VGVLFGISAFTNIPQISEAGRGVLYLGMLFGIVGIGSVVNFAARRPLINAPFVALILIGAAVLVRVSLGVVRGASTQELGAFFGEGLIAGGIAMWASIRFAKSARKRAAVRTSERTA
jgi:hypothetical protein